MYRLPLFVALFIVAVPAQNQGLVLQNGTTDWIDVPFSASLVPSGGITAEAWVTYDGSTLGPGWRFPTLFRMDPSPNQASWFLRVEAGQSRANRLLWWVSTTTGDYSIGWTFPAATLMAWTHVAGTYDGSTLRLVVNGVEVAQGVGSGPIVNRGGTFRIGNGDQAIPGGEAWNGEIDEVRVWPFARSQAAIAAAMGQRLSSVPGEVSTWNLDGDAVDSSGTNHGTGIGTPVFAPNSLVLQPMPFGALNLGVASGCRPNGLAAVTAYATLGNAGFGFVGTRAPAGAGGFAILSLAALPVPVPVLGIQVFVDPGAGSSTFLLANSLGTGTVGLPVPNAQNFIGVSVLAQFGWLDPTCPGGVSASNVVLAAVQP